MSVSFQPALAFSAGTFLVINDFLPVCLAKTHLMEEHDTNYIEKIVICYGMFPIWIATSQSNYTSLIRIVNDQVSANSYILNFALIQNNIDLGKKNQIQFLKYSSTISCDCI